MRYALFMAVFSCFLIVGSAHAEDPKDSSRFFQAEAGISVLTDSPRSSNLATSLSTGGRIGIRIDRWDVFLQVINSRWITSETEVEITPGVMVFALGSGYTYLGGHARSSLAIGTSTLLFDTVFHNIGQTGFALDLRPLGWRWNWDVLALEFHPLHLNLAVPAFGPNALVRLKYQTSLVFEVGD